MIIGSLARHRYNTLPNNSSYTKDDDKGPPDWILQGKGKKSPAQKIIAPGWVQNCSYKHSARELFERFISLYRHKYREEYVFPMSLDSLKPDGTDLKNQGHVTVRFRRTHPRSHKLELFNYLLDFNTLGKRRENPKFWPYYILSKHPDLGLAMPSPLLLYYYDDTVPNRKLLTKDRKNLWKVFFKRKCFFNALFGLPQLEYDEYVVEGDQYSTTSEESTTEYYHNPKTCYYCKHYNMNSKHPFLTTNTDITCRHNETSQQYSSSSSSLSYLNSGLCANNVMMECCSLL